MADAEVVLQTESGARDARVELINLLLIGWQLRRFEMGVAPPTSRKNE